MSAEGPNTLRTKITKVPVLGYVLRFGWYLVRLPKQFDLIADGQRSKADLGAVKKLQTTIETQSKEVSLQGSRNVKFDQQIDDLRHSLRRLQDTKPQAASGAPAATSDLLADDHNLDSFYIEFENKFRGSEDEIQQRLQVYVPILNKLGIDFSKHPILDIGCGRGELLHVLKKEKIRAIGLDLNESMVDRCKKQGLDAVQAEALEYLTKQKTGSLGAITGIHIVEHIPFSFLLRLFEECHRVVVPGGAIIFETPNPESLHVGSFAFYYDPSHLNPLVPDVLAFAIENRGFEKAEILRLHPKGDGKENAGRSDEYVTEIVRRFYTAQDYAVIGHKAKA